jgi:phosphoadenosine phosphosulfate reductase
MLNAPMPDTSVLSSITEEVVTRGWDILQPYRFADTGIEHIHYLLDLIDAPIGATVLDVGCGIGAVAEIMHGIRPDLQFILLNAVKEQLDLCPDFTKLQCDAHAIGMPDASVDVVMMHATLCNLDYQVALAEASRVLKPGGTLFVNDLVRTGGDNKQLRAILQCDAHHKDEVTGFARQMGLELDVFVSPPVTQYYLRRQFDSRAEYEVAFDGVEPGIWRFVRGAELPIAAQYGSTVARHKKVALQLSGGKDSLATLHALKPWWDRLTVYWVNSGASFPETIAFMEKVKALVPRFKELAGNQPAVVAADGWPSDIVPIRWTTSGMAILGDKPFKVQHRFDCCWKAFMLPMHQAMIDEGVSLVIRGKRHDDDDKSGVKSGDSAAGAYMVLFPIYDWTKQDVHDFLDANEIEKPGFYRRIDNSMDCMTCTGYWGDGYATYLRAEHPGLYEVYARRIGLIKEAVAEELTRCEV